MSVFKHAGSYLIGAFPRGWAGGSVRAVCWVLPVNDAASEQSLTLEAQQQPGLVLCQWLTVSQHWGIKETLEMEEAELERTRPMGGFLVVPPSGAERGSNPV